MKWGRTHAPDFGFMQVPVFEKYICGTLLAYLTNVLICPDKRAWLKSPQKRFSLARSVEKARQYYGKFDELFSGTYATAGRDRRGNC